LRLGEAGRQTLSVRQSSDFVGLHAGRAEVDRMQRRGPRRHRLGVAPAQVAERRGGEGNALEADDAVLGDSHHRTGLGGDQGWIALGKRWRLLKH